MVHIHSVICKLKTKFYKKFYEQQATSEADGGQELWSHFTRWYILTQWSTITLKSVLISLILHRFPWCDVPLESWQAALSNNDTFSIPEITVYILYTKELLMLRSFWSVPRHMLMWAFTKHNQSTTLLQIWLNFTCFTLKVLLLLVISRPPKQYFTSDLAHSGTICQGWLWCPPRLV